MLSEKPIQSQPPPLETFIKFFKFVASKEIAVVYNISISQVEREMKKLLLKQKVEQIPAKYGTFLEIYRRVEKSGCKQSGFFILFIRHEKTLQLQLQGLFL